MEVSQPQKTRALPKIPDAKPALEVSAQKATVAEVAFEFSPRASSELQDLKVPKAALAVMAPEERSPGFLSQLKVNFSVLRESVSFVYKASPEISKLQIGLGALQTVQNFVFLGFGTKIFFALPNATSVADPKVWAPVLGLLIFKGFSDFYQAKCQSTENEHTALIQKRLLARIRDSSPVSVEALTRPENYEQVLKVNLRIWYFSMGGRQFIQSVGSIATFAGATILIGCLAPPAVTAFVAVSAGWAVVRAISLAQKLAEKEEKIFIHDRKVWDREGRRTSVSSAKQSTTLGANKDLDREIDEHRAKLIGIEREYAKACLWHDKISGALKVVGTAGALAVLGKHALMSGSGHLPLDKAFFIGMSLIPMLQVSFDQCASSVLHLLRARPVVDALRILKERREADLVNEGSAEIPWSNGVPTVELRDLHFGYDPAQKGEPRVPILSGINLSVPPGAAVAILGDNGSGKSTLLSLISKDYKPVAGEIRFGGISISTVTPDNFSEGVGLQRQQSQQVEDSTISELLNWARCGRAGNPELLNRIMEKTGLKSQLEATWKDPETNEVRKRYPAGLDTLMGAQFGGVNISGGELNRLFATHLLYKEPRIICADEPTSGLSEENRTKYYDLFFSIHETLGYRPTRFLVTHNLDHALRADFVLFVSKDAGGVVEFGSHSELLSRRGLYAEWFERSRPQGKSSGAEPEYMI